MSDDNIIRVPRIVRTGPLSALSIWPPDETGIVTAVFHSLARPIHEFKSAGATRKR